MQRYTDRRTVLKATGGLLAGTTLLAGRAAGDEIKPLNVTVKQRAINPDKRGLIPTRVTVDREIADDEAFPGMVYFGHIEQFIKDGPILYFSEGIRGAVATPVKTVEIEDGSGETFTNDMLYDTRDIDFSEASGDEVTLAAVFFPESGSIDKSNWDSDTVKLPGRREEPGSEEVGPAHR